MQFSFAGVHLLGGRCVAGRANGRRRAVLDGAGCGDGWRRPDWRRAGECRPDWNQTSQCWQVGLAVLISCFGLLYFCLFAVGARGRLGRVCIDRRAAAGLRAALRAAPPAQCNAEARGGGNILAASPHQIASAEFLQKARATCIVLCHRADLTALSPLN